MSARYSQHFGSYPRTEDDEVKTKNVWMKGHTGQYPHNDNRRIYSLSLTYAAIDIDALSMLWSQPVTALQVLSPDGKWRYVKHIPNSIVRPPHPSSSPNSTLNHRLPRS